MNKKIFLVVIALHVCISLSGFASFSQNVSVELESTEVKIGSTERTKGPLPAGVGGVSYPERIPGHYIKPTIPSYVRKAKIKARVILQIVVKKDGTVGDIKVLSDPVSESLVISSFRQAAIDAVKQWKYKPAIKDGKPVDVYMTVSVNFELP